MKNNVLMDIVGVILVIVTLAALAGLIIMSVQVR